MQITTSSTDDCRPSWMDVIGLAIENDLPIESAWSWISEGHIVLGVGVKVQS